LRGGETLASVHPQDVKAGAVRCLKRIIVGLIWHLKTVDGASGAGGKRGLGLSGTRSDCRAGRASGRPHSAGVCVERSPPNCSPLSRICSSKVQTEAEKEGARACVPRFHSGSDRHVAILFIPQTVSACRMLPRQNDVLTFLRLGPPLRLNQLAGLGPGLGTKGAV
jgi:hypothetical protein